MPVTETKYSETPEVAFSNNFTEEEKRAIADRMQALDRLLQEKKGAKYKLEVMFVNSRSRDRPFGGMVTFWENANKLHGGGDTKIYICDSIIPDRAGRGCGAVMTDKSAGVGFMLCPKCRKLWRNEEVVGEVFYKLTVQNWALVLLRWFHRLDLDADIRIKYARDDIRDAARKEQEKQRKGDLLSVVRDEDRRSTSIYKLASIIKDTSTGADLYARILAYLQA